MHAGPCGVSCDVVVVIGGSSCVVDVGGRSCVVDVGGCSCVVVVGWYHGGFMPNCQARKIVQFECFM